MILVSKTFLPPIDEYELFIKEAWGRHWLTNRGPLVEKLETELKAFLEVKNIITTTNGTLPLQIAIKALGLTGEIITTPFSYVATTAVIAWEHCKPVFVDIHPEYLSIDEEKIEAAITSKTSAILATHVFGNPCKIERIEEIAKKFNLSVIYDAAHCFSVKYKGKSIFTYGNISTCSFHATKLFHTGEGGAMFTNDDELNHKLFYHHNFGHNGPIDFHGLGINAKLSELHAAMGLAILPHLPYIIAERKVIVDLYFKGLDRNHLQFMKLREETDWNYSYFPIIFESEEILLRVQAVLQEEEIYPRRYFYPSLNTLNYVEYVPLENSESTAARILCLPLYVGLEHTDILRIIQLVNSAIK